MEIKQLINRALGAGKKALDEAESKRILRRYGIPVVAETVAATPEAAAAAAAQLGFPVAVKARNESSLHKTEAGLVRLDLADEASVWSAAHRLLQAAPGSQLLVQPLIQGRREFVAGLVRDPQFGPAILFGLGGIFTEALSDVVFRLAPLTRQDAVEMIDAIRARSLLGAFRGDAAVDRPTLERTLLGLSDIAMTFPEITEIDINPLIATPSGSIVAVDALMTLSSTQPSPKAQEAVSPQDIRALFYPRSVAFVGASSQMGKWGHMLICNTISGGYEGQVYAVNPKGGIIAGMPAFQSVAEIPGPVDLAVVTIPAAG
ncbi:MAG TPA: acetate--CoA ligase family protein, partial [Desulfosarcina sp.]|nr:acetate--CoA ligase family protein [Desulfosarcina sp.]